MIKYNDKDELDIKNRTYLTEEQLQSNYNLYFMCRNLRATLIFEACSALFMFRKFIDGVRYIQKLNTIFMVIHYASVKLIMFLLMMLIIWGLTLIIGQATFGPMQYSFKHLDHAINSIGMIFFGKVEFMYEESVSGIWSFIFIFVWFLIYFFSRALFLQLQLTSVKMIALSTGFIDP